MGGPGFVVDVDGAGATVATACTTTAVGSIATGELSSFPSPQPMTNTIREKDENPSIKYR